MHLPMFKWLRNTTLLPLRGIEPTDSVGRLKCGSKNVMFLFMNPISLSRNDNSMWNSSFCSWGWCHRGGISLPMPFECFPFPTDVIFTHEVAAESASCAYDYECWLIDRCSVCRTRPSIHPPRRRPPSHHLNRALHLITRQQFASSALFLSLFTSSSYLGFWNANALILTLAWSSK